MKTLIKIIPLFLTALIFNEQSVAACNVTPEQIERDDVLVVVNDNSKSSPEVGDYYCEQRRLDPNNVAHIRVPVTNDVELDQFISLRDQIIKHMQENTLPAGLTPIACDTEEGYTLYYCPESIKQLRENSSIRYIVMTKGLPIRFRFTGSNLEHNPEASVDNYLLFWLSNYFAKDEEFNINNRAVDFEDGRGMREINPEIDFQIIIGRIDGVDTDSAKQLVNRAINAEKNGIYGKLYGNKFGGSALNGGPEDGGAFWKKWLPNGTREPIYPSWRYLHGLFGEFQSSSNLAIRHTTNSKCINPESDDSFPNECVTVVNKGGVSRDSQFADLPPGNPEGGIPTPDNALVHQAYLDGFSTLSEFNHLLNWRDNDSCSTLCENSTNTTACMNESTDTYKEINTSCVRVAEGYLGYSFNSYPVGMMASWPTGWFQSTNNGADKFDQTGSAHYYFWQPEVRNDIGFDDNFSLWYRNTDNVISSKCYLGEESYNQAATEDCNLNKQISLNQRIVDITERAINPTPQKYKIRFKYRGIDLNRNVRIIARIFIRESEFTDGEEDGITIEAGNQVVYDFLDVKTLQAPNDPVDGNSWGDAEATFTLDPELHRHPQKLFDGIKIRISIPSGSAFKGELALDNFSLEEDGVNIPLINPSFNEGHKQLSGGDSAATFLSRLNGTAFWANLSHHGNSNGRSFTKHPYETLIYFLRGLPLGDAVWFAETDPSGIFYGDPLYSPIAVHLHYKHALDTWAPDDQFSTIHDSPLVLTGDTLNGTDAISSTRYSVSYCTGDDFLVCDQNGSWNDAIGLQNLASNEPNKDLGSWDISALPEGDGDFVLRLAVTSTHPTSGASQTFYDYYPINLYTPAEDEDGDGLTYTQELAAATNPRNSDTDNDGLSDKFEIDNGLDPLVDNIGLDSDGDGVEDFIETRRGTDLADAQDTPIISTLNVDPVDGTDNGASPFKTVEAALASALAGDKIVLSSGNYNSVSLDFAEPVEVLGPEDKSAIFQSARSLRNRTIGTVQISSLTFSADSLIIAGGATDSINRWQFNNTNFSSNIEIRSGVLTEFKNSLFTDASEDALNLLDGSSAVIQNCTLSNNKTGVRANTGSNVKILNSIISGNTSTDIVGDFTAGDIAYSLIKDIDISSENNVVIIGSNGNIDADPLFVDSLNGDYHLKPESPAIDAGDPESDFSLEPVPTDDRVNQRINLGVYGNTAEATIAALNQSGDNQPAENSSSGQLSWPLLFLISFISLCRARLKAKYII